MLTRTLKDDIVYDSECTVRFVESEFTSMGYSLVSVPIVFGDYHVSGVTNFMMNYLRLIVLYPHGRTGTLRLVLSIDPNGVMSQGANEVVSPFRFSMIGVRSRISDNRVVRQRVVQTIARQRVREPQWIGTLVRPRPYARTPLAPVERSVR